MELRSTKSDLENFRDNWIGKEGPRREWRVIAQAKDGSTQNSHQTIAERGAN